MLTNCKFLNYSLQAISNYGIINFAVRKCG